MADYICAFWSPGPMELIIIALIAVLLFGRRLPEIARNIGRSMTEFKKGVREAKDTKDEVVDDLKKEARDASGIDEMDKDDSTV